ncbi:hypothetical protein [Cohnella cellulosilytica]|uniref:MBL fold metallo-hydrolase n=1 Tax=Cohnella cellulosilytica TaxID=986710 RepID=A0ABW2FD47_9BACL
MSKIGIQYAEPGDVLATDVRLGNGSLILASGQRLTSSYIEKLKKIGIKSVDIVDTARHA